MSKFTISYDDLSHAYKYNKSVTSDKSLSDTDKNTIFLASKGIVKIATTTPTTTGFVKCDALEGGEDEWVFQVPAEHISKILSSYNNMPYTIVSGVTFEEQDKSVHIIVHLETKNDEIDESFAQDGHFRFGVVPVQEKVLTSVNKEFPEEHSEVSKIAIDVIIRDLHRLASNSTNSAESLVNIAEDYVFVNSSSVFSGYKNTLPKEMSGVALNYSQTLALITASLSGGGLEIEDTDDEELLSLSEDDEGISDEALNALGGTLDVARVSKNVIAFRDDNVTLFITARPVKIRHENHFNPAFETDESGEYVNRGTYVSIDRVFFKDVLKRLDFDKGENVQFNLGSDNGDFIEAVSKSSTQLIPIQDSRGEVDNITFKLSAPILSRAILGSDSDFEEDSTVTILLSEIKNSYKITVLDDTNTWLSTMIAKKR